VGGLPPRGQSPHYVPKPNSPWEFTQCILHSLLFQFAIIHSLIHQFIHSPILQFIHSPILQFIHSLIHSFTHWPIHSLTHSLILRLFCTSSSFHYKRCCLDLKIFKNRIMLKKNLLLIFGLLGLVSLMAENGPKRSNVFSMLGLHEDPACCDVSACCPGSDADCCDMSTCCTTASNCCATVSNCCASDATDQTSTSTTESRVNQCNVQCK